LKSGNFAFRDALFAQSHARVVDKEIADGDVHAKSSDRCIVGDI
jgi:hypothetical protein